MTADDIATWPARWDHECVLCGEPRLPDSQYCARCIDGACSHCFVVHDRNPCTPPELPDPTRPATVGAVRHPSATRKDP